MAGGPAQAGRRRPTLLRVAVPFPGGNDPDERLCKDRDGRYNFGNKGFCETTKRPLAELIGKTDFDIFPAELAGNTVGKMSGSCPPGRRSRPSISVSRPETRNFTSTPSSRPSTTVKGRSSGPRASSGTCRTASIWRMHWHGWPTSSPGRGRSCGSSRQPGGTGPKPGPRPRREGCGGPAAWGPAPVSPPEPVAFASLRRNSSQSRGPLRWKRTRE